MALDSISTSVTILNTGITTISLIPFLWKNIDKIAHLLPARSEIVNAIAFRLKLFCYLLALVSTTIIWLAVVKLFGLTGHLLFTPVAFLVAYLVQTHSRLLQKERKH
jgi:ABC-type long-subunit fatty acid transport system fused permease/ATPase subunit